MLGKMGCRDREKAMMGENRLGEVKEEEMWDGFRGDAESGEIGRWTDG